MDLIVKKAHAKINLGLDVTGRRPDGYHEIEMVMQSLGLCDIVALKKTAEPGIRLRIDVPEEGPDIYPDRDPDDDPDDGELSRLVYGPPEKNLAWRAAKLLMDEFSPAEGVEIALTKYIPVAAGLAGGSTDAAAVLSGMNELFGLGLGPEALSERGLKLGADVPYCLFGGTALARGIGEILTPLPPVPDVYVLLAKPSAGISTAWAYARLDDDDIAGSIVHPDIAALTAAIRRGSLDGMCALMGNVFECAAFPERPEISAIKQAMIDGGALGALMSGSGPTVFGIFDDIDAAKGCQKDLMEGPEGGGLYTCVTDLRQK